MNLKGRIPLYMVLIHYKMGIKQHYVTIKMKPIVGSMTQLLVMIEKYNWKYNPIYDRYIVNYFHCVVQKNEILLLLELTIPIVKNENEKKKPFMWINILALYIIFMNTYLKIPLSSLACTFNIAPNGINPIRAPLSSCWKGLKA